MCRHRGKPREQKNKNCTSMKPRCLLVAAATLAAGCATNPEVSFTPHEYTDSIGYHNPVIRGFYPDPSICRAGEDYYLVTSSFEYFPGVPVFHSTDLVNWEQVGNALDRESQLPLHGQSPSGGIFAPTIRYHDGTFYMITTNIEGGKNFIVTADNPAGPWSEPLMVPSQNIDPSLFFDDDGTVYYTGTAPWNGSGPGIYQAEIDLKTGELLTDYRLIWEGTGGRYPEGPHLYKLDGWYYLMISEGGTESGHTVTIARSKDPYGPFEACPHNPILTNREQPWDNPVQNSGHADLVKDPDGRWWMVHLAVRNVNQHHHLGRETFLLPLDWDSEGWPVINRNGISFIDIYAVPPAPQKPEPQQIGYDFSSTLGPEWSWLRNPDKDNYRIDTEKGVMEITGTNLTLDSLASPSFVGLRQKYFNQDIVAEMSSELTANGDETGMTVYMNPEHYYTVSRVRSAGTEKVRLTMKLGKIRHTEQEVAVTTGRLWLKISSDPLRYRFYWSDNGTSWNYLGENYARLISTETAGGFTGVLTGPYVISGNPDRPATARFHSISILRKGD